MTGFRDTEDETIFMEAVSRFQDRLIRQKMAGRPKPHPIYSRVRSHGSTGAIVVEHSPMFGTKNRMTKIVHALSAFDPTAVERRLHLIMDSLYAWEPVFKVESWGRWLPGPTEQEKFRQARGAQVLAPWLELGVSSAAWKYNMMGAQDPAAEADLYLSLIHI